MLLLNPKNLLMLVNSLKSTLPQLFSLTQSALMPKKTSETVTPPTEMLFLLESQFTKELTKKPEEFSTIPLMWSKLKSPWLPLPFKPLKANSPNPRVTYGTDSPNTNTCKNTGMSTTMEFPKELFKTLTKMENLFFMMSPFKTIKPQSLSDTTWKELLKETLMKTPLTELITPLFTELSTHLLVKTLNWIPETTNE